MLQFNFNEAIKLFFMVADVRLACSDPNGTITDGEIPIFDMAGLSIKHLTRVVLSTLRVYMKYTQVSGSQGHREANWLQLVWRRRSV